MEIGEKIKFYRLKKRLTQMELAKASNISRVSIGNYERGDRIPSVEVAKKIANGLDVSVSALLTSTESALLTSIEPEILQTQYKLTDKAVAFILYLDKLQMKFIDIYYDCKRKANVARFIYMVRKDEGVIDRRELIINLHKLDEFEEKTAEGIIAMLQLICEELIPNSLIQEEERILMT